MDKLLMEIENMNNNQMNSNGYYNYFHNNNYNMYHRIFNTNNMRGGIDHTIPTPLYQSLPLNHFQNPPLLPLPIKSYTLPSTNKKINNMKPRNQNRKKKQLQRKETKKMDETETMKPVTEEVKEEIINEKESSLATFDIMISPPPASSVPLPSLLLMRPKEGKKSTVSSCKAEAIAADDLCKLLRI